MIEAKMRGLDQYLRSLGGEVYQYGNASHAFKDILLHLKTKTGDRLSNVVMPSFIPAKLYRTVLAAGYRPKFYDVTEGCRSDLQQVEDLVDEHTTSIFAIHYFGRPANIKALRDIAARYHVALIEDCAHVLLGSIDGKPLGTFGDFSIFSARKMLQLSDGGFLLINKETDGFTSSYEGRVRSIYTSSKFLFSRSKHFYLRITRGRDPLHVVHPPEVGRIDPQRRIELRVRKMSYMTTAYARMADINRISATRRLNYLRLFEALKGFAFLKPAYEQLPDCWTPYSLPMMVDGRGRSILHAELLGRGVSCGLGWPESPFDNRSTGTRDLAHRLIEFPVHPLILEQQFDRITDACKAYGRK